MMRHCITVPTHDWDDIRQHLFHGDVEQAAIIFATVEQAADGLQFNFAEKYLFSDDDFDSHLKDHIVLRDQARGNFIKAAWDNSWAIIEVHSHRTYDCARFSPSDWAGFDQFVPHVWWRLQGRPYAALVLTETDFDAIVWSHDPRVPEPLSAILVDDGRLAPTGRTFAQPRGSHVNFAI